MPEINSGFYLLENVNANKRAKGISDRAEATKRRVSYTNYVKSTGTFILQKGTK